MFPRRWFSIFQRVFVFLSTAVILLSVSGQFRNRSNQISGLTLDETAVKQASQTVNYWVCGAPSNGGDDIFLRVSERIKCRSTRKSTLSSSKSVSTFDGREKHSRKLFLTHDLFNAIGLGNFMFMAAALLGLADSSGRKPFFFEHHHHMRVFGEKFPMADQLPPDEFALIPDGALKQNVMEIKAAGIFDAGLPGSLSVHRKKTYDDEEFPSIIALRGYLQSWKYFHSSRSLIQRQFAFSSKVFKKALTVLETAVKSYTDRTKDVPTTIIGIHVRRGDILKPVMKKYGHTAASQTYLTNLVANMTALYRPALFVVLSNDLKYCKGLFGRTENVVVLAGNTPEVDMAILSLMDHLILTVGTFGWWGAYLSDAKDVFYYRDWPIYGSLLDNEYHGQDYFLPDWKPAA